MCAELDSAIRSAAKGLPRHLQPSSEHVKFIREHFKLNRIGAEKYTVVARCVDGDVTEYSLVEIIRHTVGIVPTKGVEK